MDQCSSNQGSSSDPNSPPPVWWTNIPLYEARRCICGAICTIKEAYTWKDFSRMYHGCPYFQLELDVGCNFFDWEDPEMCGYGERAVQKFKSMYQHLTSKCSNLDKAVVKLKTERAKHGLENANLKMENTKFKVENANLKKHNDRLEAEIATLLMANADLSND